MDVALGGADVALGSVVALAVDDCVSVTSDSGESVTPGEGVSVSDGRIAELVEEGDKVGVDNEAEGAPGVGVGGTGDAVAIDVRAGEDVNPASGVSVDVTRGMSVAGAVVLSTTTTAETLGISVGSLPAIIPSASNCTPANA